jgi:hypothetical protein
MEPNGPKFKVGQRVRRISATSDETGRAKVLGIQTGLIGDEPPFYHIEYDEGSDGWWPEDGLEAYTS